MLFRLRIFVLTGLMILSTVVHSSELVLSKKALLELSAQADDKYPTGAVLLHKNMLTSVDSNGLEHYQYYTAIKIQDAAAARDYSQLNSRYNAWYYDKEINFARVVGKDGKVTPLKQDAIVKGHAGNNAKSIDDIQSIKFALPNVKPGSIIELHITTKQLRPVIEGQWFGGIRMNYLQWIEARGWPRVDPVMQARFKLIHPSSMKVQYKAQNLDIVPTITQQNGTTQYEWEVNDLEGIPVERSMPSLLDVIPSVEFTSINDWGVIDGWAAGLFAGKADITSEIADMASEIAQQGNSNLEKVQAVFKYVQNNVRYIGAHVNRGGYEPHTATEVLQQAYGDCKDQSMLIVSLLRALNVQASPVLISTDDPNSVDEAFPIVNFSHMITYVPELDIWLDTSDMTGNFPGIYSSLEGQTGLIVNGKGGDLKTIEKNDAHSNEATVMLSYRPIEEKQKLALDMTFRFTGHMDTLMRNLINNVPDVAGFIKQLVGSFNQSEVTEYKILHQEDWNKPLEFRIFFKEVGEMPSGVDRFTYADTMRSMVNNFTEFQLLSKPEERIHGFNIQFPFKMTLERNYPNIISDSVLAVVQTATEMDSDNFTLSHDGDMDDSSIRLKTHLLIKNKSISRENYAAFYKEVKQIEAHSTSSFVYVKDMDSITARQPENDDIDTQLDYAENLLDAGKFVQALEHTEKLIGTFPDSAQAHYLHGLALGFNDKFEESQAMFDKAEALGY